MPFCNKADRWAWGRGYVQICSGESRESFLLHVEIANVMQELGYVTYSGVLKLAVQQLEDKMGLL